MRENLTETLKNEIICHWSSGSYTVYPKSNHVLNAERISFLNIYIFNLLHMCYRKTFKEQREIGSLPVTFIPSDL